MARGEHKSVSVKPFRVQWVVFEVPVPQDIGHGGGAKRESGMAAISLLDSINRESSKGVDAEEIKGCCGPHTKTSLLV
jgi:hypothetical protein